STTILFEQEPTHCVLDAVQQLFRGTTFSGQFAFDWIHTSKGCVPIECNPRATSGVHLLGESVSWQSFIHKRQPRSSKRYGLRLLRWGNGAFGERWRGVHDVVFDWSDMGPFVAQWCMSVYFFTKSVWRGRSIVQTTTADIEWNGEENR
ncbi:MAG: hypothetical protein ACRC5C_13565, partial [Bacilli bacterium]